MPCFIDALATLLATQRLSAFDLALVAVYLIGITLFGLRFRKSRGAAAADRSLKSYFLADNTIPWWAIALSVVSAETSTLTIISIPGVAFAGDFGFLQVVIGYMLGRVVVAALFLPRYFAGEMLTAYQLIDRRFGGTLHKVTAALFLVTRAAAEGVRVFAVSIVVGIAIGTRDVLSIAIISALTLLYTFEGGMAAVVWTDVVQMAIYVGGTVVALLTLGSHVQGGWPVIHSVAAAAGKFHMFNFVLNLTTTYTFWAGVLGGTFLTMASHGTDQLMVQRLLAARNLRQSTAALLSSGVVIFVQFALFLLIGAGLYVFYQQHPGAIFRTNDYIFPTFIVREMPIGVAGLLVAAILAAAMSNLSAALNSLSSTTVVDFYMRFRPNADNRERAMIAKSSTVLWAFVLFAIAVYSVKAGGKGHVVEIGLSIASVAYGCLLGVFLLGTLTRFANERGAIIGMICGFILNLWIWQGAFPVHLGPITIPHIAWTWYVLIGAAATFLIGAIASLFLGKRTRPQRTAAVAAALLPLLFLLSFRGVAEEPAIHRGQVQGPATVPAPDFSTAAALINDAITYHHLPGAVLLVGHSGRVVFEHAYGDRKLAGEPGLNGEPSPAEPMTEDTIFDMASLSKNLSTSTSIMQLYEQGKLTFDEPVEQILPAFNPDHDPERAKVTVRMLLTHYSGEPADISLKDAWGLAKPDKAEGINRALTTPLQSEPAEVFRYSDINFILLGDIVETLSGEPLDVYAQEHIFKPLGMTETRYLPIDKACGPHKIIGAAIAWAPAPRGHMRYTCPVGDWSTSLLPRIAPTTHDDESKSNPGANPHFDMLTRGTVHDPTTRRMGGVAGHAGVFSTAHDVSLFAQALLDRLAGRPSNFPLKQSTLELMTTPEQPGYYAGELTLANTAEQAAIVHGEKGAAPLLAPRYPAIHGQDLRGFGWDIDTPFSKPRGMIFPIGSFGHTGFTGTSLWMDPGSDTYVVLLANAIHPRGNPPISNLRGEVATAVAHALELYTGCPASTFCNVAISESSNLQTHTLTGIDVLESDHFADLTTLAAQHNNTLRLGILTNQSGVDAHGRRTIDIVSTDLPKIIPGAKLTTIFSPEHGIFGKQDTTSFGPETDPTTGLQVTSLYGPHDADKRPSHDQLANLDAVVIDLQDAGVRTYTYEAVTGYFLEAAAREQRDFHHMLNIVVLDRPDPIGGIAVQGPVSDPGHDNYTDYGQVPIRHGMTLGELARFYNGARHIDAPLTVIAMQHWTRAEFYDQTGLPWVDPSPNLHNITATILLPALTLLEPTNASVGRGTPTPFELFGAGLPPKDKTTGVQPRAWFRAADVAAALDARHIPGVAFAATTTTVDDDPIHPFHGQTIEAVRIAVTDRNTLDSPELGVEIQSVLHKLYPQQFHLDRGARYLANSATQDAIARGDDPRTIAATWQPALDNYKSAREPYLLYK
ncbi:MAG TPA: sodium/solute symporter [Acidobacteriaceae bacterium]|nr:sodium/solute symporter [Acidobacteriaceae bacterium]